MPLDRVIPELRQDKQTGGGPVVLIGGDSRAARAIGARLSGRSVTSIVRRDPGPGRVVVDDYAAPSAGLVPAGAVVVNCVGTPVGDAATLARVNIDVPQRWATLARDAGARLFIQLSSFSLYGASEVIDPDTKPAPASAYGQSKLDAEFALADASGGMLPIALLRIPILVGRDGNDKLGNLLSACRRLHVVPGPVPPVKRSMLSYDGLAAVIALVMARDPADLTAVLADPEPFSYEMIRAAARAHGVKMASIPIPAMMVAVSKRVAPALAQRLFTSSLVSDDTNFAKQALPFERVSDIIDAAFADSSRVTNR